MCGKGNAGLGTICGVMGLPPLYFPNAILNTSLIIQKIAQEVCEESSRSASAQLCRLQGADPDDVDVTSHVMVPGPVVDLWQIMVWWQCCHGRQVRYLMC